MADVLTQIQERQARAQEQELASAQSNLDWNTTFGRMPPDEVLRESRNMTALIANAVERKAALAAQTNAEAQRIYITDQKFKAWQQTQPLRDDLLKAQIRDEEASERARAATELLTTSRKERDARTIEQTALAQWEMDEIENSNRPESEKRAWLNTVRGKYPAMDKDTTARHESLRSVLNPQEKAIAEGAVVRAREEAQREFAPTPEQIEAESAARARGTASVRPEKDPVLPSLEKERSLHVRMLDRAKRIRSKATDADIIADADSDIQESERALAEIESQIRTARTGPEKAVASASIPELTSKDQFDALPSGAQYMRGGKLYRKP